MILNDFTEPKLKFSRDKLDAVLAELCSLVIDGQRDNPDFFGMVAAAVIDPRGRLVTGVNYLYGNGRVHAERAAIDRYEEAYGELPRGSIVVTTLSPCSQDTHDNRHGASCTGFLNSKHIKLAYCGYKDPTQQDKNKFTVLVTDNSKIEQLCKRLADTFLDEDFDPNQTPPGPEFPPTMPAGTVKVGVSDVYDWYKLGQHISNLKGLGHHDFGQGPPSTIISFGSEEAEHKYLKDLKKLGLPTVDVDPKDPNQPKGMPRQPTDPTYNVDENFADGKKPGRKGLAKRSGVNCKQSVSKLRSIAAHSSGEKQRMAHWCANMKSGKKKKTNEVIHHPGIKTKTADSSGLVNKGEPVPLGKEQKLLGTKVGNLGAYEVYKWDKGNDSAYSVYDPKTRISQMTISGHNKAHSFEIFGVYGGPKAPIRAADLYAWLVKKLGLTLVSDKYQSPGGQRVWQELEQRYGRSVNVYAFNMKTNQPINTGADDPESTHGTRGDIAQNVRLVAAPK